MSKRWFCMKCSSWNGAEKSRCGYCSNPMPRVEAAQTPAVAEGYAMDKIVTSLHNAVEKLLPRQKNKLLSYIKSAGALPEIKRDEKGDAIAPDLHEIIKALTPLQQKKLHRFFEDNIL